MSKQLEIFGLKLSRRPIEMEIEKRQRQEHKRGHFPNHTTY
jgi:hypothetical protein